MADTLSELTSTQRDQIAAAVQRYITSQNQIANDQIGIAYAAGRNVILDMADETEHALEEILAEERMISLLTSSSELITGGAATVEREIYALVSEFYAHGKSPNDLENKLRSELGQFENSWRTIARDQIAKAQLTGRNYSYQEINCTEVEISCAPDACEECLPFDGETVDADDEDARPQFHIQCACMDIPKVFAGTQEDTTDPIDEASAESDTEDVAHTDEGLFDGDEGSLGR